MRRALAVLVLVLAACDPGGLLEVTPRDAGPDGGGRGGAGLECDAGPCPG